MKLVSFTLMVVFFLIQVHMTPDLVWVDDFNEEQVESLPEGWKGRKKKAKEFYKVVHEAGDSTNHYLKAHSVNSDMFIIKKVKVDIAQYPYLNWKWRPNLFPPEGNEFRKKTCDVVASMNVVLVAVRWKPKTIKYSWSTTLPVGSQSRSPFSRWPARADVIVLESGQSRRGEWVTEKVNVFEDYKRLYKKEDITSYEIDAIVIMSDSDNTQSESAADYDDIFFSKE